MLMQSFYPSGSLYAGIDFWFISKDVLPLICSVLLFHSNLNVVVLLCQLSEEGPCEELSGDGQLSSFNEWILPAKEFDGMWERYFCCLFSS